ncbi:MAG: fibronectin type III domain-containing protein [Rhodopirellula sp.]|nr:fibronectin type III domain-containing protein [Rhodopirellula sp.]
MRFVEPGDDPNRGHQFSGLNPDSFYVVQITTTGETTVVEEFLIKTEGQESPKFIEVEDKTLVSFKAVWDRVSWNVQSYRVVLNEVLEDGTKVAITRPEFEVGPGNGEGQSELVIDGLRSGGNYEFTVEAYSAAEDPDTGKEVGWIPNENVKSVELQAPADLQITGLRLVNAFTRKLEVEWDPLQFDARTLFVQIREEGIGEYEDIEVVNVSNTSKLIENLKINTSYELRMKAVVAASNNPPTVIDVDIPTDLTATPPLVEKTVWTIDSVDPKHQSVKVTVPRITEATHFEVRVFADADLSQQVATSGRIKKDESGPNTIKVEGLSSNQTYYAVAYAYEQTQQIAESAAEEFTTLQTEAPTAGISVGATDRHKFVVSMSHPSPNEISSLAVEITPDDGVTWYRAGKLVDSTVVKASDLETTRLQFEVTHYKPLNDSGDFIRVKAGVTYRARVVATYPDGSPVPSETTGPAQTAPLVAPTITDAVPDFKSISVTFSHTDPLGGVEHFKLRYTTDDPAVSGESTNWIPVDGTLSTNAPSGTINGLDPGTTYFVQVRAVYAEKLLGDNYVNEFEAADAVVGPRTTSQISPPTEVVFGQVERGSVRINWQSPASTDFHSYNVTLSLDGGVNWRSVENGSGTSGLGIDKSKTSFVVSRYKKNDGSFTSLEAETDYLIRVAAVYFNDNQKAFSNENGHPVQTAGFVSPHDLAVSAIGLDQLTVSWKHDDLGGVDSFRIRLTTDDLSVISPENANWSKVIDNIGKAQESKVVTGLTPGTRYYVQVRAVYGTSPLKTGDAVTGPHQTNPAPPASGLDHTDVRQQQIDLKWNALGWTPESQFIEVRIGSGDWFRPDGGGVQVGLKQNTITGLTPATAYQIRHVATYTSALGQEVRVESASITRTTLAYSWSPNLLVDGVTHNSATANWGQLTNGGPDGYIIRVYRNGALVQEKNVSLGSGRRSSSVGGLAAFTPYEMEVVAVKGSTVLATTPRAPFKTTVAPSPPTGVTLSRADWRQLQVQWTAPAGNFDSYVVRLYNATTNQVEATRSPDKTARSVNIGSLAIDQSYYAIVVAKTDGAETPSAQSALVSTYARETPVNLGVSQTDNRLFFTWNHFAPIDAPLAYRIERLGGQGNWQPVKGGINPNFNGTSQAFNILRGEANSTLNKNQQYEFRVVAVYNENELPSAAKSFTVT